ncbi:sporulation inhibitor of replication protein SirA [Sporosarcina pasteurii]|uniref:Protein of uncharacterized function (DUF2522) n=1 Tax=Sporosarcina pasteurii TaxID=1474 RepID=A0A380BHH5_SPOPA|nr:sporulation inhibitor of replication protein SirA [Sporosarcina pasteurii]MDS9470670.1 sporulation inhibitor of replication protein SirA [Sporosarcina pasteurii]QBQ05644.1 sporulation inhibitor of replication protein SirA [Sporosarcina pasteurii]SUJ01424.1 Protein of uncharacterised function (DUF2522) [Sporosarcina pasteurii]
MRSYGIYKIKEMYEQFILGREQLLYDLLKENVNRSDDLQEVRYLCDIVDQESVDHAIVARLGEIYTTVRLENGQYKLTHPVKGTILITFSPYSLTVKCDGSRMLDLDLFVALSEADRRFFAIMNGQGEWGWLKPVKHTQEKYKSAVVFR